MPLLPFLKWPGGKRWLIARHAHLLPSTYDKYFEPFLGGGSVFFHLQPKRAVLSDTNAELIQLYTVVAWRRRKLEQLLALHQKKHDEIHYYRTRDTTSQSRIKRAARTLYLNRTCFNGMYRVNLAGTFNVPIGEKTAVLMDTDDFEAAARLLRKAELRVSDFEPVIAEAKRNDFVFADPPYIVGHNNNGFVKYNETLFRWGDQIRLANALQHARDRGAKIVSTNAAHGSLKRLYLDRGFDVQQVERFSSISGNAVGRCRFQELVVTANISREATNA